MREGLSLAQLSEAARFLSGLWFGQVYLEEPELSKQGLTLEERYHRATAASFSGPGFFLWNKNQWAVNQVTTRNKLMGLLLIKRKILCMGHALPSLPLSWFPFMLHPAEFNL